MSTTRLEERRNGEEEGIGIFIAMTPDRLDLHRKEEGEHVLVLRQYSLLDLRVIILGIHQILLSKQKAYLTQVSLVKRDFLCFEKQQEPESASSQIMLQCSLVLVASGSN
jgi:hypothetical protein